MPVTTFTITGTVETPDSAVESGYVEFTPNTSPFVNGGVVVPGRTVRANLDSTGAISVTLIRCASGYTATMYLGAGGVGSTKASGSLRKIAQIADAVGPVDLSSLTWA